MNSIEEYMLKTVVALDSRDPAVMRRRLEESGLEPTEENLELLRKMMDKPDSYRVRVHPAHLLKTAMETGIEMLPYLAGRTWNLVVLREPLLVTTDHPLTLHSDPESSGPFGSVGVMTADEVWMPLDPTRLLVMTHPDTEPRVGTIPEEAIPSINLRIAAECHAWVVGQPGNPHLPAIAGFLEGKPAPMLEIMGPTLDELSAAGRRMSTARRASAYPPAS